MLIRQKKQVVVNILETWVRCVRAQQVGKKPYEDSEICHFSTVSRVQWSEMGWGAGICLQSKRHITASYICYKEGSTVTDNTLGSWKQHILHLNIGLVHKLVSWKTTSFEWGPE